MSKIVKQNKVDKNKVLKIKKDARLNTYQRIFYSNIFNSPNEEDKKYIRPERSLGKKMVNSSSSKSTLGPSFKNKTNRNINSSQDAGISKLRNVEKIKKIKELNRKDAYSKMFYSNIFNTPHKNDSVYQNRKLNLRTSSKRQFKTIKKNNDSFKTIFKLPSKLNCSTGKKIVHQQTLTDTLGQKDPERKIKVRTVQTDRKNNSQISLGEKGKNYITQRKPYISDYSIDKYIHFESPHMIKMKELYNPNITDINYKCIKGNISESRDNSEYNSIMNSPRESERNSRLNSVTNSGLNSPSKRNLVYRTHKSIRQKFLEKEGFNTPIKEKRNKNKNLK
ncbi:MAG: hypothetical protein MJ252_31190 [archaeon]|nr:hypothetical protein [archaeon]